MISPAFNDRIERKFQIGISESQVADLWRYLRSFLRPYGLAPAQEITSVGSVYFDNKNCDLLRYSLLGHLMIVRIRKYELFGRSPEAVTDYWMEVKTAEDERRRKRRFRLTKDALMEFLEGGDAGGNVPRSTRCADEWDSHDLYRETQETVLTMGLSPVLLVTCKRIAFQGEVERLSIDWDVQYRHVTTDIYDYNSWKYFDDPPAGKADKVIMEFKSLRAEVPAWFCELQKSCPIQRREYLKPVEGMGFLFQGPLKHHKESSHLLPMIQAYMANSEMP